MKRIILLIIGIYSGLAILAQVPQSINYQTIIRNTDGNIMPETEISVKLTLISGAPEGEVIYQELHHTTTNDFGLVNLKLGGGIIQSGNFTDINWGKGPKFLEVAISEDGGQSFTTIGVSQFQSTPYSFYSLASANGVQSMTTLERDALENPAIGKTIYNSTTNCFNYYNGMSWFEACGHCTPTPTEANAGADQYFDDETFATILEGNTPEFGEGEWSIVSGTGGYFNNANDPSTLFTGEACENYILKWVITNLCGSSTDSVNIHFATQPTIANAGEDQIFLDTTTSTVLQGNTPQLGEGIWAIVSGQGGAFDNPNDPTTVFTGLQCETYVLRWTISTTCQISWDEVIIQYNTMPTVANAGEDQSFEDNTTSVILEGNVPIIGQGMWSIVSGQGGSFVDKTNPTTEFQGQPCQTYTLRWQINTQCNESSDEVTLDFFYKPSVADAGYDITIMGGDLSAILNANTPEMGDGSWSVLIGEGGTFDDPTNPQAVFTGEPYVEYTLEWSIETNCDTTFDALQVLFDPWLCGMPITDVRDNQQYETVLIGNQCWMAENLNIGEQINSSQEMTNNTIIEKYCYLGNPINCGTYGGMYQWDEMMQYDTISGIQGICPPGWHIPSDDEWKILEGTVDSQFPVGDPEWDELDNRGFDAGGNVKEVGTIHWIYPNTGATNNSGFTARPGGYRYTNGTYYNQGYYGYWFSSSKVNSVDVWCRTFDFNHAKAYRHYYTKMSGQSVRCLSDESFGPYNLDLLVEPLETGTVTGVGQYDAGDEITITATSYPGWTFLNWIDSDGAISVDSAFTFIMPEENIILTAVFREQPGYFSCGDSLLDFRDDQFYLTVQIGDQCWMAENLNIGERIDGVEEMTDNATIEKYCYNDSPLNCDIYGGLYQWNEVMQYSYSSGIKGICPVGWHIPTDNEWKILEGTVDSQYPVGDPEWDEIGDRGLDAGKNLKSTTGWSNNGNGIDLYGFSALAGGTRHFLGTFQWQSGVGMWWSSDYGTGSWYRYLGISFNGSIRSQLAVPEGYSVRCIKSPLSYNLILEASPSGSGAVQGSGQYEAEEEVSVSAIANYGWEFINWKDDNNVVLSTDSTFVYTMPDKDAILTAYFEEEQQLFNVILKTKPLGSGILEGCGQYEAGEQVIVTASAYSGWEFVSWTDKDNIQVSEEPSFEFTMPDENILLTANFLEQQGFFICGDTLVDFRDSQSYLTVQIGSQCWMAENLNIGTRINGTNDQSDNGAFEKFCYNNSVEMCEIYGGLYQWNEMMQYSDTSVLQGICPAGWHLPTDEEWKTLEGVIDSQYPVEDPEWDDTGYRGFDVGQNMKSTSGWSNNGNGNDTIDFHALPGGIRGGNGYYSGQGSSGYWWSSNETPSGNAVSRELNFYYNGSRRFMNNKANGFGVRCIKGIPNSPTAHNLILKAEPEGTGTLEWSGKYEAGQEIILSATANSGWEFVNWIDEDGVVLSTEHSFEYIMPNQDITLTANFEIEQPTYNLNLLAMPEGSGIVEGAGQYEAGEVITITATANPGWEFVNWTDEDTIIQSIEPSFEYAMPEKDAYLTANFIEEPIVFICGDTLIDTRDGQEYETVQIGDQCWMAENLNIGTRINGNLNQTDNGTIEKYCYNNSESNCDTYGGLYQWDEIMIYTTTAGIKGICPDGWHIPTDSEWEILEGTVDSQYPVGDPEWDIDGYRGFDVGLNLKSNFGWIGNGTDPYGFSALPSGTRYYTGGFDYLGGFGAWWSSEEFSPNKTWMRLLNNPGDQSLRSSQYKDIGYSVRCLKGQPIWPSTHTLTLEANPTGSATLEGFGQYEAGEVISVSAYPNFGWDFVNWSDEDGVVISTEPSFDYTMPNNDITLFALFVEDQTGFNCGNMLIDSRDGKEYQTIQIGTQCWMAENLAYLPEVSPSSQSSNINPYYYVYDYQGTNVAEAKATANYQTYGVLYNWPASLNACPEGWHLPSDYEWTVISDFVSSKSEFWCGNDSTKIAKALAAKANWNSSSTTCAVGNNISTNNATGFSGLPGGFRYVYGSFRDLEGFGKWWTSTEYSVSEAWRRYLTYGNAYFYRLSLTKSCGFSVRCLRD
jgi:uncharacterized protein (TIGR02145 family)